MSRMELVALGLTVYLAKARCCLCLPLSSGGILLCWLLLARGSFSLFGVFSTLDATFAELSVWPAPRGLALLDGAGDVAAALAGTLGVLLTQQELILGLTLWLCTHLVVGVALASAFLVLGLAGVQARADEGLGHSWRAAGVAAGLLLDVYLLLESMRLLLQATLRARVAPSAQHLVAEAQHVALAAAPGSFGACGRRHLVTALLEDDDLRLLLEAGGADVARMAEELTPEQEGVAAEPRRGLETGLPLGPDFEATIHEAVFLQARAGDDKLRADHLVMALCRDGEITVGLGGHEGTGPRLASYSVNAAQVREHLEAIKRHAQASRPRPGPPPPLLCGCLPLEEAVAAYAALEALVHAAGLCRLAAPQLDLGLPKALGSTAPLEAAGGLLGLVCCILGLAGICGHRHARWQLKLAAYRLGAAWDAGLDVAYGAARGEPEAPGCFQALQRAAERLALLLAWAAAELALLLPACGLALAEGNVCGSYDAALAPVGRAARQSPLHCGPRGMLLVSLLAAVLLLKAYMCWALLALWHQYACGWTTTDARGPAFFKPFSPFPERLALALAGAPGRRPPARPADETSPLLL